MALNTHLGFLFKATDQASGVMRRISLGLGQLTHGSKLAAQAMAGVSLSFAGNSLMNFAESGAKAIFSAAQASGKFTQELTTVKNVIDGISDKEVQKIGDAALSLGAKFGVGGLQMAKGAADMGRAGLDAQGVLNTLEPTLLFATSAELDFDKASQVLIGTMNAFKMETKDAGIVVDKFANILNSTMASGADIQSTFAKAAGMAGMFGQDIDQTLVLLGLMRQINIDASSISTAIRESHRRIFSMPSVINELKAAKINPFDEWGKPRVWADLAMEVYQHAEKLGGAAGNIFTNKIYGARGTFAGTALEQASVKVIRNGQEQILSGYDAFMELMAQQKKRGTARKLAESLAVTFEGQTKRFTAILDNLKISLGKAFEEAFAPALKVLNSVLESLGEWLNKLGPEGRQFIATLALIEVGVVGITGAMMALLGSLLLLKLALPIIAPMLVPILAITLSVLGVTAGLVITYKALQGETSKTGTFLEQLATSFGKVKLFAQGLFQLLTTGRITGKPMTELLKGENKGVLETLGRMWQHIARAKAMFEGFMEGIRSHLDNPAVKLALESLKNAFSGLMETLGLGENGLDKLTNSTSDARETGKSWGKWLIWVTFAVISLADALVRLVDLLLTVGSIVAPVADAFTSTFGKALASILALMLGIRGFKWVGRGIAGMLGMGGNAAAAAASGGGSAAGGAAAGAGGLLGRFFGAANNLRKAGGTQVLSASGEILASQAPNIGRQLLNLTGITHLGKLTTSILGRFQLTSGLAQKLAGSAGAMTKGTFGFVAAAGAAGYALGTLIDNSFGLSDKISKWFYKEPEELKMKDNGAYLKTVAARGAPAFFDTAQAKAENAVAGAGPGKGQVSLSPETISAFKEVAGERGNIVMQMDSEVVGRLIEKRARNNQANSFDAEDDN